MDRSIGRDGRGRARGWVMDDERRGPSRWMTIDRDDRWVEDDRVDRSRRSARSRSCADRRDRRVDRMPSSSSSANGAGVTRCGRSRSGSTTPLGSTTRREDRGGGRARGMDERCVEGVGRGRVRSGRGDARERETRRGIGDGDARGRVYCEDVLNFCARVGSAFQQGDRFWSQTNRA